MARKYHKTKGRKDLKYGIHPIAVQLALVGRAPLPEPIARPADTAAADAIPSGTI